MVHHLTKSGLFYNYNLPYFVTYVHHHSPNNKVFSHLKATFYRPNPQFTKHFVFFSHTLRKCR